MNVRVYRDRDGDVCALLPNGHEFFMLIYVASRKRWKIGNSAWDHAGLPGKAPILVKVV